MASRKASKKSKKSKKVTATRKGRVRRQRSPKTAPAAGPARVGSDELLTERAPIAPMPDLEDPRVPTWSDQVAAIRVRLLAIRDNKADAMEGSKKRAEAIAPLRGPIQQLTGIYRYMRSGRLTNNEMGYGERITEPFFAAKGGQLHPVDRTSQRTKSGRQSLKQTP